MKKEVLSAVNFLVDLLRINSTLLTDEQLLKFRKHAYECLWQHYQDHWFPETPMKGSGYRCIRINGKMDPLIARAGELVGLAAGSLRALFPSELTMWVDPSEVAYRIGENGSICNLYAPQSNTAGSTGSTTSETKHQEEPSPVKAAPPKHQPPSSPQLTIQQLKQQQQQQQLQQLQQQQQQLQQLQQQQLQQQHFSPSKTPSSPPVHYHSPPRSPVFNTSQHQQMSVQQQQHLAMFLMNNHHPAGNCKDSLRSSALESSARGMERLFVSS